MSYSHLFVLDPLIRAREDKDGVFDYYRDSLTHILANDILLSDEYALLRAIAVNENYNFDEYAVSIVDNCSIADALPKTDEAKYDFLQHLAVLILVCSDKCRTEDVIIFDAVARKYGFSLAILDDVVQQVTLRIGSTQQHHIDLRESIIASYTSAKLVYKDEFIRTFTADLYN
jgi:hypothetical protein